MFFDTKLAERLDVPMLKEAVSLLNHILANAEGQNREGLPTEDFLIMGDQVLAGIARRRLKQQRSRQHYLPQEIFRDPAWNILLDLFVHEMEGSRVCVSDACLASGVAPTTALRWITQLEALGLVERCKDAVDARRSFLSLTETTRGDIRRWLREDY